MHPALILLASLAAQATTSPAPPAAPARPATSYDCRVELATPEGRAEIFWRLLPDGRVIEHSGSWSSTWRQNAVRLWLGWGGTDADPLRPDSLASISPGLEPVARRDMRRRVRMELRMPGALGNVHWFAFATPYAPWNEVAGRGMVNWGELQALSRGGGPIEIRIVDPRGQVLRTSTLAPALIDEAGRAALAAQAMMIEKARDFRQHCEPYDGDPYNRDIVVT